MPRNTLFALASALLAALLVTIAVFVGDEQGLREWLVVLAVIVAATVVLFWIVVPRVRDRAATAALVLAALGLVSLLVFWLGLPAIFAGAAAYLAIESRRPAVGEASVATVALVVAGATVVGAAVLAFVG